MSKYSNRQKRKPLSREAIFEALKDPSTYDLVVDEHRFRFGETFRTKELDDYAKSIYGHKFDHTYIQIIKQDLLR